MFTLSEKELVLNANADVEVYDPATGTARATSAAIVSTDYIRIKGLVSALPITAITDFKARRAQAPIAEVTDWLTVAPASIAVGEAIEVKITYKSSRYAGEDAINYIEGSRPIVFQTAALIGVTAANIRDAVVLGWAAYLATFAKFDPKITVTADGAADIRVTVATGHEYLSIQKVEIRRIVQGAGSQTGVLLAKTLITAGTEGYGQGKFLEESIRMASPANTNPYGIGGSDWAVDIRGSYTQVFIEFAANYDEAVIPHGVDLTAAAKHKVLVYLNEANCIAANAAINDLAAVGVIAAGLLSNVAVTAIAAPLTRAQEEVEALIIATGASVATAANFIS